jgi:IPT/TIG domain
LSVATTTRVSAEPLSNNANGFSDHPSLTHDGRFVAFTSRATNIAGADGNSLADVFVRAVLPPSIVTVTPSSIAAGGSATFNIIGSRFTPDTTVSAQVSGRGAGITIETIDVISDVELDVTIALAPEVPAGELQIFVHVPGLGPGFTAASTTVCLSCPSVVIP